MFQMGQKTFGFSHEMSLIGLPLSGLARQKMMLKAHSDHSYHIVSLRAGVAKNEFPESDKPRFQKGPKTHQLLGGRRWSMTIEIMAFQATTETAPVIPAFFQLK